MTIEEKTDPGPPSLPASAAPLPSGLTAAVTGFRALLASAPARFAAWRAAAPDALRYLWANERHWLWVLLPFALLVYRSLRWTWGIWFPYPGSGFWTRISGPLAFQVLVPLAAAALAWSRRAEVEAVYRELAFLFPNNSPKRRGHLWPVLVGCILVLTAAAAILEDLAVFALVFLLASIIYYVYGRYVFRALLAPIAFLFLLVPPPANDLALLTLQLQVGGAVAGGQAIAQIHPDTRTQGIAVLLPGFPMEVTQGMGGAPLLLATLTLTLWVILYRRMRFGLAITALLAALTLVLALSVARIVATGLLGALNPPLGDWLRRLHVLPFILLSCYLSYRFTVWLHTRPRRLSDYEADLAIQSRVGEGEAGTIGVRPFEAVHPDQINHGRRWEVETAASEESKETPDMDETGETSQQESIAPDRGEVDEDAGTPEEEKEVK